MKIKKDQKTAIFWTAVFFTALFTIGIPSYQAGEFKIGLPTFAVADGGIIGGDVYVDVGSCEHAPSTTFNIVDKYNTGTAYTPTGKYRVGVSGAWTSFTAGTAITTLNPNDTVTVAYGADNAGTYNGFIKTYRILCAPYPSFTEEMGLSASASTVAVVAWNSDGTVNTDSNEETLTAGTVDSMDFQIKGHFEKDYGTAGHDNILVLKYNNTVFESLEIAGLSTTTVPTQVDSESGFKFKAWKTSPLLSSEKRMHTLSYDLQNTITGGLEDTGSNLVFTLYDSQLYEDSDANLMLFGVEDENEEDIGISSEETWTLYID